MLCFRFKRTDAALVLKFFLFGAFLFGYASEEKVSPPLHRLSFRHIEPGGIGYREGYTSFNFFTSLRSIHDRSWLPLIDGRAHIFDNGKIAANGGGALRYLFDSWVFGVNGYFDYRRTKYARYQQAGVGLELLGRFIDIRANGYIPLKKAKSPFLYDPQFSRFEGNRLLLKSLLEFSMGGVNLEMGWHAVRENIGTLYVAGGPYYFSREDNHAIGGELRVFASLCDRIRLEAKGAYDSIFKWTGQGEIGLYFPLGRKNSSSSSQKVPILWQRSVQPIERNEIIIVDKEEKEVYAVDPETNQPITFWFVDNTSHSKGTFESPFSTIEQAENASSARDVIYVYPGNGLRYEIPDHGLRLKDHQKLWGASIEQTLRTKLGEITIPRSSSSSPVLGGGYEGNIVTLAKQNEICGIHFSGEDFPLRAIFGGPSSDSGILRENSIRGTYTQMICFQGGGELQVINNQFSGEIDLEEAAIFIHPIKSDLKLSIIDNTFTIKAEEVESIHLLSSKTKMEAFCSSNTIHMIGKDNAGICTETLFQGSLDFACENNILSLHGGTDTEGIVILSEGGQPFCHAHCMENKISCSRGKHTTGIWIETSGGTLETSLEKNVVLTGLEAQGIVGRSSHESCFFLEFKDNTIYNDGAILPQNIRLTNFHPKTSKFFLSPIHKNQPNEFLQSPGILSFPFPEK